MTRLTISIPDNLHKHLHAIAAKQNEPVSRFITQLVQVGLQHWYKKPESQENVHNQAIEEHCQLLIIQINALIKHMAADLLKLDKDDFARLQIAAATKLANLQNGTGS